MAWWDKWRAVEKPVPEMVAPPGGQTSMTLEERMAFRRQMVLDSVRDVMSNHGLLSAGYRQTVARLDARGHKYAVMVELMPLAAGRQVDSPGELQAMEARITRTAMRRYKIKVSGVYWRVVHETEGAVAPAQGAGASPAIPQPPVTERTPVFLRRKTDHPDEQQTGFPDTRVEARPASNPDSVSPDELAAFEQALKEGTSPQSVQLGRRTYETDFSPLA